MSQESPQSKEFQIENSEKTETNIVTLEHCQTVGEMIERVKEIKKQNEVSLVMLGEYTFEVGDILEQLETISNFARDAKIDFVMAPDNEYSRNISWGEIKEEFIGKGAEIETTEMSNEHKPETIGIFVNKDGKVFVFPKTWGANTVHRPIHTIPNTNIGVTICGEIGEITVEDLDKCDDMKVIYNPSREADDPSLKFRVLNQYGSKPLTREKIADILKQENYYKSLLDDSLYDKNAPYPDYIEESDSREARERQFNDAVDKYFELAQSPDDSLYVEKISEKLKERGISVVRCDGNRCSGILNQTKGVKNAQYNKGHAVFKVVL